MSVVAFMHELNLSTTLFYSILSMMDHSKSDTQRTQRTFGRCHTPCQTCNCFVYAMKHVPVPKSSIIEYYCQLKCIFPYIISIFVIH